MSKKDETLTAETEQEETQEDLASSSAQSTGDSPQADATKGGEDWEKRFKGLQPVHQKTAEELKKIQQTYQTESTVWAGEKSQLEAKVSEYDKMIADLNGELESAKKGSGELQGLVDSLEKTLERKQLIMSEYPDLALFEAKDLIPSVEGDELTQTLQTMRNLLSETGKRAATDLAAGATGDTEHVSGSRTQGGTVNTLMDKIMEAQKAKNFEEADRLTQLLIKQANTEIFQGQGGG